MARLRRRTPEEKVLLEGSPARDKWVAESFPLVWEHLTLTRWEDGAVRQVSTLLIFAEGAVFKACLNDRAEGLSAFATADTIEGLFVALEAGLEGETLDWRAKKPWTPSPNKRRG